MKKSLSKREVRTFFVLLAGGLLLAWWLGAFRREPLHKGKPISYWVDRACLGLDDNQSWKMREEVRAIGEPAVPYLVKKLNTTERGRNTWNRVRTWLPKSLQERFPEKRPAQEIHYGAARTLALLGPVAKPAVPDLIRLLPESPNPVLDALTAIGTNATEALPALHGMLTNRDANRRVEIAQAIWFVGRETNIVLDVCTNAMLSGVENMNAPGLLIQLKTGAAPAAPIALQVLQELNHSSGMRANSAIAIGVARVDRPEIRAALLAAANSEKEEGNLRSNAALALWGLDSQYAPLGTRLMMEEIVREKEKFPGNEQNALLWLEMRGLDPRECVPTLKELSRSDSEPMRKEAALTLERIEQKEKVMGKQ